MPPTADSAPELTGPVIADIVDRLEDLACLAAWKLPDARECEMYMVLQLARLRALEAASAIAALAERAQASSLAA